MTKHEYNDQEYSVSLTIYIGKTDSVETAVAAFRELIAEEKNEWEYEVENVTTGETKTVVF
jgi:hypothetical protein